MLCFGVEKRKGLEMKKTIFLLATCLSFPCWAGLNDGILAYNNGMYPNALMELTYLQEEGNPIATYYLGKMYLDGAGVVQDKNRALSYFRAADSGFYFPATALMGKLLLESGETQAGLTALKTATLAGESEAAFQLGLFYSDPNQPEFNLNQAYGYYLIAALAGNMKAQYQLAEMYLEGRGVPLDYKSGFTWMTRAAKQGYVLAQIELADLYLTNPQYKNRADAYGWYSIIAAYNFDEVGQRATEKRDELERRLKKKELSAIQQALSKWKPSSADKSVSKEVKKNTKIPVINGFNDPRSLQELFEKMGFIPRNPERYNLTNAEIDKAIGFENVGGLVSNIEQAFKEGKQDAYGYFGDLLMYRMNNAPEAFKWYQKGAQTGDTYAQYQMAQMLCEGIGTAPDTAQCYFWMQKVKENQDPVLNTLAQRAISTILSKTTQEELDKAIATLSKDGKNTLKVNPSGGGFNFF